MKNQERQTLVVEFLCDEKVGTDEMGSKKVKKYLEDLAFLLGKDVIKKPVTHLSPKYGLSGWVPLDGKAAIHFYAWDDRNPSFVSVDISTERGVDLGLVLKFTGAYFRVKDGDVVFKIVGGENERSSWRELDGNICRQRMTVTGKVEDGIWGEKVGEFLRELSDVLEMDKLSEPLVHENVAWMHWETSGVIASWDEGGDFHTDIYTCKKFDPEVAENFVVKKLGIKMECCNHF